MKVWFFAPQSRAARVSVLFGDDSTFNIIYKFWSAPSNYNRFNGSALCLIPGNASNVAINADGRANGWPAVFGSNALTQRPTASPAPRLNCAGQSRLAADTVGANARWIRRNGRGGLPIMGRVYFTLTNNKRRLVIRRPIQHPLKPTWSDRALGRADGDQAATQFEWDIFRWQVTVVENGQENLDRS